MTIDEFIQKNKTHLDILCRLENYTLEHSWSVLKLSYELGKKAKLAEEDMENLLLGAVFHDIGKSLIPQDILNKPGKLTDEEFNIVKKHPELGYQFMKENSSLPKQALEIILDHHERIDGTGYPKNKKGDEISTLAKIVSICDVYNALATNRVYRKAMCTQEALMVLEEAKGTQLDCQLVNTFKNEVVPFI